MSKDAKQSNATNQEQEFDKEKFLRRMKITIVISVIAVLIGAATVTMQVMKGQSPLAACAITAVLAINLVMNLKAYKNGKNYNRNSNALGRHFKVKRKKLRKTKLTKATK